LEILLPNGEQGLVTLNNEINAADSGIEVWVSENLSQSGKTRTPYSVLGVNVLQQKPTSAVAGAWRHLAPQQKY
jgi:hypothetical protein